MLRRDTIFCITYEWSALPTTTKANIFRFYDVRRPNIAWLCFHVLNILCGFSRTGRAVHNRRVLCVIKDFTMARSCRTNSISLNLVHRLSRPDARTHPTVWNTPQLQFFLFIPLYLQHSLCTKCAWYIRLLQLVRRARGREREHSVAIRTNSRRWKWYFQPFPRARSHWFRSTTDTRTLFLFSNLLSCSRYVRHRIHSAHSPVIYSHSATSTFNNHPDEQCPIDKDAMWYSPMALNCILCVKWRATSWIE